PAPTPPFRGTLRGTLIRCLSSYRALPDNNSHYRSITRAADWQPAPEVSPLPILRSAVSINAKGRRCVIGSSKRQAQREADPPSYCPVEGIGRRSGALSRRS